jgi:DNA-binding beta-propeller fold protein YncE
VLGFRVVDLNTNSTLYVTRFKGFTWNPRFGPDPPSHGLSLAPDRPELWVLDAPNSVVHLFDVSELPGRAPRPLADIRLSKPISGNENPCTRSCGRIGSLQHSADGRFVYVGDAGDVIDTQTHALVANLEALHNSRAQLEVDWVAGKAVFPGRS